METNLWRWGVESADRIRSDPRPREAVVDLFAIPFQGGVVAIGGRGIIDCVIPPAGGHAGGQAHNCAAEHGAHPLLTGTRRSSPAPADEEPNQDEPGRIQKTAS
ncbi:hypothetical protein AXG93_4601s1110 [Marchantia polymorpha subsp. ruderalis]|uniref:Uncharacterized protein n=1 Tax=Marchantia polymorpha subsp. ruderalis TaxID=1480154 RepID=A0A176W0L9_MARPO|nr:hypothetical protein AXG93_4601s1110 [Marchantia polymorpha subsp. ruderalis]